MLKQPEYEVEVYQHSGLGRNVLEFVIMLVIVVGTVILLRTFVITPYEVPTGSMETTIMVKDRVFSERVSYYFRDPQPGEIVTLDDPQVAGRTLVKRLIATEGHVIDMYDGVLYIDGVAQTDETYTRGLPTEEEVPAYGTEISYPYTIPAGYVWVMGDNRTNSADSRYFGAVPKDNITGHVVLRYWPLDRLGGID